jgi:thiol-disulfide isomerase/thioredoxin
MKLLRHSILVAFTFSLINFGSFAQKTCFEGCWTRMENSESPFAPIDILKELQGCDAPDFNVRTIEGEEISFKSLRNNVIVINFWFIGCKPCVEEMPRLNDIVDLYKDKNVVFLSFARDIEDDIRKKFLPKRTFK